ncbi:src-like-adapter isoform X1 [Strigops habroptila]|uniref:src-like-adapter isoform X1 n=1 Tax=Strigops habroptila TaxID=2489341 RepID=UPI0011CF8E0B|nr:src-like-adapter isoform X1 [Strigops habroptila]
MGNTMKTPRASEETNVPSQMGQESDFLAVLYDYPSSDISQPIFHVGEKLRVLSDEGGWWRVHSLTTGRENYIPGKYVAKVYHGWLFEGLGREKAEELLLLPNTKVGSFMIRESETRKGLYSLSVRHRQVKHYRIFRLPNNWYYISPRQTFQCLEDLVNHYSEVADGLCCVLTTPCLTQCTNNSVMNQVPPVVMRNKNFNWRNIHRYHITTQAARNNKGFFPAFYMLVLTTQKKQPFPSPEISFKDQTMFKAVDSRLTHENWMSSSLTDNLGLTSKESIANCHFSYPAECGHISSPFGTHESSPPRV